MEGIRKCSLYKYQIDSLPEVLEHTCFIREPLQISSHDECNSCPEEEHCPSEAKGSSEGAVLGQ